MMPKKLSERVLSYASILDEKAADQARTLSTLPFLAGDVALMPDAHWGLGATIGTVIATERAVIPAAVGVDIGCGMAAARTVYTTNDLPDSLDALLSRYVQTIPAGVGQGHQHYEVGQRWYAETGSTTEHSSFTDKQADKVAAQFGTLGSGNHFIEVCLDAADRVWVMLHSGSRGIGNQLARLHIDRAKGLMEQWFVTLPDPDLAYLVQGTPEFDAYIADVTWAQQYAAANRARMMTLALWHLQHYVQGVNERNVGTPPLDAPISTLDSEVGIVNCHHNYCTMEHQRGRNVWVTRKGAIRARHGDLGIIPGSMGAKSYIVRGKGDPASYFSAPHGAGRLMSRKQARQEFSPDRLAAEMGDRAWRRDIGAKLTDEAPGAYKDIDQVMADSVSLVEVLFTLRQILSYKGI